MTRLKFDVTGVDPGGDFKTPTPGAYKAKIDVVEHKDSSAGNPMVEVQYVVTGGGEFDGSRIWDYYPLHVEWKWRRFLEAVGAVGKGKEKGEINLEGIIGKRVLLKVTNETDEQYGTRARVGNVTALRGDDDEDDAADDDAGDDSELDDEDGDGLEEDLTADDIRKMKKVELRDLLKENDIEGIRVTKQSPLDKLRERVVEKMIEEEMIAPEEAEEEGESEGESDEDVEEVEDYAELEVGALRSELKARGLPMKGTKKALVARLEKDDEDNDVFG